MSSKVVIITGASGGVGSALTTKFKAHSYTVFAIDKVFSADSLADFDGVINFQLNLSDLADGTPRAEALWTDFLGAIPGDCNELVVINNAALQTLRPIELLDADTCRQTLDVNTVIPLLMVSKLSRLLRATKGKVINISSIHASQTKKNFSIYAASKAALESLTRSIALEFAADGVITTCIAPAALETPMLIAGFEGDPAGLGRLKAYHPSNSIGTPNGLADLVFQLTQLDN